MKTVTTNVPAEVSRLIADGYRIVSIAYWVDNPVYSYTLEKQVREVKR